MVAHLAGVALVIVLLCGVPIDKHLRLLIVLGLGSSGPTVVVEQPLGSLASQRVTKEMLVAP